MDFYSNNYDLLTGSERSLLHYILDHQETIQKMTCQKLADQCGVSKTVVINMSQKLGFEGYNDLRFFLKNRAKVAPMPASAETVEAEITGNVSKTIQLNRPEILQKAARSIVNSQCVYIISRGTSKPVGYYLEHLLLTLNVKCINIPDYNLIAISLSGKTPIIVETAKIVKAYGNSLITLTAFSNSPLVQYSDLALYCSASSMDTKVDDIITRIGMFAVTDLLVHYVQVELLKQNKPGF